MDDQTQEKVEEQLAEEQSLQTEQAQEDKQDNTKHRFLPVLVDAPISEEGRDITADS